MSRIKESALELIGGTPLLRLSRYAKEAGVTGAEILAKLEYLNPAGSVKDRVLPRGAGDDRGCGAERNPKARRDDH